MKTKMLLLFFLSISSIIFPMEESINDELIQETQEEKYLEDLGLPNEIWAKILKLVYYVSFDLSIIDKAKDIHEAMDIIEKHISKCRATISLVCKTFNDLNISRDEWNKVRGEIRKFYIPYLNKKFLEEREGKEGLYPKIGEWNFDVTINNNSAIFILTGKMVNNALLIALIRIKNDSSIAKKVN